MTKRCHILVLEQGLLNPDHIPDEYLVSFLPFPQQQVTNKDIVVYFMEGVFLVVVVLLLLFLFLLLNQRIVWDSLFEIVEGSLLGRHHKHIDRLLILPPQELLNPQIMLIVIQCKKLQFCGRCFLNFNISLNDLKNHKVSLPRSQFLRLLDPPHFGFDQYLDCFGFLLIDDLIAAGISHHIMPIDVV